MGLHLFSMNWWRRHDFPVPALPITRNLNRKSETKRERKRKRINTTVALHWERLKGRFGCRSERWTILISFIQSLLHSYVRSCILRGNLKPILKCNVYIWAKIWPGWDYLLPSLNFRKQDLNLKLLSLAFCYSILKLPNISWWIIFADVLVK